MFSIATVIITVIVNASAILSVTPSLNLLEDPSYMYHMLNHLHAILLCSPVPSQLFLPLSVAQMEIFREDSTQVNFLWKALHYHGFTSTVYSGTFFFAPITSYAYFHH